jgi:hypothetical protein
MLVHRTMPSKSPAAVLMPTVRPDCFAEFRQCREKAFETCLQRDATADQIPINRRGHAYLRLIGWRRRNIAGSIAA